MHMSLKMRCSSLSISVTNSTCNKSKNNVKAGSQSNHGKQLLLKNWRENDNENGRKENTCLSTPGSSLMLMLLPLLVFPMFFSSTP
jgi:hypothetical protein